MSYERRLLLLLSYLIVVTIPTIAQHVNTIKKSSTCSIVVNTDIPSDVTISLAPLLYNKKQVITIEIDDGLKDIYTTLFQLCEGGTPQNDPNYTSQGLYISDGCGNKISFKATSTCFVNRLNPPLKLENWFYTMEKYPNKWLSKSQMDILVKSGYGINDHGFYNDMNHAKDISKTVSDFIAWSESSYNFRPLVCVTPGGVTFDTTTWIQTWFANGAPFYVNGSGKAPFFSRMDTLNVFSLNKPMQIGRFLLEKKNILLLIESVDLLMKQEYPHWFRTFGHNITNNEFIHYNTLKLFLQYIELKYGIKGEDNIWVASVTDVVSYLYCRNGVSIHHHQSGLKHTFLINSEKIPTFVTKRMLTLLFSSNAKIVSIEVDGCKYSKNSAMVNLQF